MGTLKIILTLFSGVVFAALVLAASSSFDESRLSRWLKAIIGACAYIVTNLAAPVAPAWLGLLTVALPLGVFVYLFIWWAEEGSSVKELIFFTLVAGLTEMTAMAAMARSLDLTGSWVARGILMSIPGVVGILFFAFMISNMIAFRQQLNLMSSEEEGGDEDDEDEY